MRGEATEAAAREVELARSRCEEVDCAMRMEAAALAPGASVLGAMKLFGAAGAAPRPRPGPRPGPRSPGGRGGPGAGLAALLVPRTDADQAEALRYAAQVRGHRPVLQDEAFG